MPSEDNGGDYLQYILDLVLEGVCDLEDFVIAGSARLWIAGVIPRPSDLDIVARKQTLERLRALAPGPKANTFGSETGDEIARLYNGKIEVSERWVLPGQDADKLIDSAELVRGLPFMSVEQVVQYKSALRRPKDREHLAALWASEHMKPQWRFGLRWIVIKPRG